MGGAAFVFSMLSGVASAVLTVMLLIQPSLLPSGLAVVVVGYMLLATIIAFRCSEHEC